MDKIAIKMTKAINLVVKIGTFGRIKRLLEYSRVTKFFREMHEDATELLKDKRLLIEPFIWGIIYAFFDVLMFFVVFLSLGSLVNPAILVVGYGIAGMASLVSITPGGAGVYELIMIFFLRTHCVLYLWNIVESAKLSKFWVC